MIINANFDEARQSQLPAVELLINMGYQYLSREHVLQERQGNTSRFILKNIALTQLRKINTYEHRGKVYSFSDKNLQDAIDQLDAMPLEGLIDTSREVYNMITRIGGKTVTELVDGKSLSQSLKFIDFERPQNNVFQVSVEFEASGKADIRPDVVCYVNGIPFVVMENKKSSVDVAEALTQMSRNQGPEYCPRLFVYPQLLIGTNGKVLKYGTTGTPNKFFAEWKEKGMDTTKLEQKIQKLIGKKIPAKIYGPLCEDLNGATAHHQQLTERMVTEQDRGIYNLLRPERLLDLARNYILYDAGIKKISRYQQYFAIRKMLKRIEKTKPSISGTKRQGGLVWHTQGSGKSLTMVMFVKALIEDPQIPNPRVIVVTDRKDLNKQISDTFRDCNLKKEVAPAKTGTHLLQLIEEKNQDVITTLVHKFEKARPYRDKFVDYDENIFVLIDEAHRTQWGIANAEMHRIIPNACYIGFTGTPLMKQERLSARKFGGYIDKYTIDDALTDGVILPLVYQGRFVEMTQNKKKIDQYIDRVADGFNQEQRRMLQSYVDSKVIKNNPHRIAEIAYDIERHYLENFHGTGLKAQVVAPSKHSALLFQQCFAESGKLDTAVVISDIGSKEDEEDDKKKEVIDFLSRIKHQHRSLETYEKAVIDSFKHNPDGVELLIVVDKLLTGFDAPRNTVLYLAKDLKDHNLLQAIARVNRLFENKAIPKTTGFIIDYSENAKNLDTAMKLFGNYDEEDVKHTLIDVDEKIEELESSYDRLYQLFKAVQGSRDDEAYVQQLADEQQREQFYQLVNDFVRHLNECLALPDFVHQFKHLDTYKRELKKFLELRGAARLRYADTQDFSEYKTKLVKILDQYVDAEEVQVMTGAININDKAAFSQALETLGSNRSRAEAIAAQTERTIRENLGRDPEFYRRFSDKIKDILQKLKEEKLADLEALKQLTLIKDQVLNKEDEGVPAAVAAQPGADIFYRNLKDELHEQEVSDDQVQQIILDLYAILQQEAIVDWYRNSDVKRMIFNRLDDYLYDEVQVKQGIRLQPELAKTMIDKTIELAVNNHELFSYGKESL